MTCVLCRIADGREPADVLLDDGQTMAILPLRPMAPVHILLFPRAHFSDLPSYLAADPGAAGLLMAQAAAIATERGLADRGFRLAWNFGPDTNQRILHPHLHLVGGTRLRDELA